MGASSRSLGIGAAGLVQSIPSPHRSITSSPILRKLTVRSSGLLWACDVDGVVVDVDVGLGPGVGAAGACVGTRVGDAIAGVGSDVASWVGELAGITPLSRHWVPDALTEPSVGSPSESGPRHREAAMPPSGDGWSCSARAGPAPHADRDAEVLEQLRQKCEEADLG